MKTAEEIVARKGQGMIRVSHDTVVCEAIKIMNENHIGSVLVEKDGKIAGIWTERDFLTDFQREDFKPREDTVEKYMKTGLHIAAHNETAYQLMDQFLGKRMRHLLIQKGGELIGLLSMGDIMRAMMTEKDDELKRLNAEASWSYYEDWKWEKGKMPPVVHNVGGLRIDPVPEK